MFSIVLLIILGLTLLVAYSATAGIVKFVFGNGVGNLIILAVAIFLLVTYGPDLLILLFLAGLN